MRHEGSCHGRLHFACVGLRKDRARFFTLSAAEGFMQLESGQAADDMVALELMTHNALWG